MAAATDEEAPLLSGPKTQAFPEKGLDAGTASSTTRDIGGHPETSNSWWITAIQLMNSMLGSGILAFPYTLAAEGWIMFATYALFFGCLVLATSVMLIEAGEKRGKLNLSDLTEDLFGRPVAQLLKVSIVLTNAGALLSYLNVIGSLGNEVLTRWFSNVGFISTYPGFMVFVAVLVLPLNLYRTYGDLAFISVVTCSGKGWREEVKMHAVCRHSH